ncbi:hypothetical protein [Sphingomonas prati]|uniref:Uncharacterized protein n=1 Tax=Sphingomonas prati TaxID=1843237 RepID=A0A7W9F1Y5_9SPHN|nr:hypothetical protein [Sphingomonas prati]MBB5727925.1 hypothetical protein [Sphingomonas prati]
MPLLLALLLTLPSRPRPVAEDRCTTMQAGLDSATAKLPPETNSDSQYYGTIIVTATQSFCMGGTVVTVYRNNKLHWALRKISVGSDLTVAPVERWAYSTNCPAILDWLERLEQLPIRFGIGPIRQTLQPRPSIRLPMLHGTDYTVRGYGWVKQPSGAPATLSLSSNDGEVATWARGIFQATVPCWKPA